MTEEEMKYGNIDPEEKFAKDLFNDHYFAIMNHKDSGDFSEEILITLLAKRHSVITIEYLMKEDSSDKEMLLKAKTIIENI